MLRRAASLHIEATQLSKFAAAWRIALAVISGWPEAPSSPLHGNGPLPPPGGVCGGAGEVEFGPEKMLPNRFDSPPPADCALAAPDMSRAAANMTTGIRAFVNGSISCFMSHPRCRQIQA